MLVTSVMVNKTNTLVLVTSVTIAVFGVLG